MRCWAAKIVKSNSTQDTTLVSNTQVMLCYNGYCKNSTQYSERANSDNLWDRQYISYFRYHHNFPFIVPEPVKYVVLSILEILNEDENNLKQKLKRSWGRTKSDIYTLGWDNRKGAVTSPRHQTEASLEDYQQVADSESEQSRSKLLTQKPSSSLSQVKGHQTHFSSSYTFTYFHTINFLQKFALPGHCCSVHETFSCKFTYSDMSNTKYQTCRGSQKKNKSSDQLQLSTA